MPHEKAGWCSRTILFLFTHIGLTAVVIGYSIGGAFLFQHLENGRYSTSMSHPTDTTDITELNKRMIVDLWEINDQVREEEQNERRCETVCIPIKVEPNPTTFMSLLRGEKERAVRDLWTLTLDLNVLWRDNWTILAEHHLDQLLAFTKAHLESIEKLSTQKPTCTVTCTTSAQATNGSKENWMHRVASRVEELQINLTSQLQWQSQHGRLHAKWSFSSSFLYALSVITTIGYGHVTPTTTLGKVTTILYALVGIPIMLTFLTHTGNTLATLFRSVSAWLYRKCSCKDNVEEVPSRVSRHCSPFTTIKRTRMVEEATSISDCDLPPPITSWDVDVEQVVEKLEKEEKTSIPIAGCLLIMAGYLFGGAGLFSFWEKWPYLDAFYFCFVTLTTIGFGDFVPGDSMMSSEMANDKLIMCCLYVLIGLTLIACCFNLMRQQVGKYFRMLAGVCQKKEKRHRSIPVIVETRHVEL